ncbi:DUF6879 family protein [Nonomuraea rubra]|uniref:DUF6879 family protein n=1 Tax=Nonomuraea rubra TaxID=46180 RepID=UPI0033FAF0CF
MIQTLADLFAKTAHSVTHLELRDTYGTQSLGYQAWQKGSTVEEISTLDSYFLPWTRLIQEHVARGVTFRRARVISEPASDYIRYEHAVTPFSNLEGGELVRWLPRLKARDIAVPACDFWQFDNNLICWVYQSGDGDPTGHDLDTDPAAVRLCSSAFEAIWERAIDHSEYKPA